MTSLDLVAGIPERKGRYGRAGGPVSVRFQGEGATSGRALLLAGRSPRTVAQARLIGGAATKSHLYLPMRSGTYQRSRSMPTKHQWKSSTEMTQAYVLLAIFVS